MFTDFDDQKHICEYHATHLFETGAVCRIMAQNEKARYNELYGMYYVKDPATTDTNIFDRDFNTSWKNFHERDISADCILHAQPCSNSLRFQITNVFGKSNQNLSARNHEQRKLPCRVYKERCGKNFYHFKPSIFKFVD